MGVFVADYYCIKYGQLVNHGKVIGMVKSLTCFFIKTTWAMRNEDVILCS